MYNIKENPFTSIFQSHYEETVNHKLNQKVNTILKNLLSIDDDEIIHYMINELGNTLMLYTTKLHNQSIQAITLKIDTPEEEYFIPSIILASAYDTYTITDTYSTPHHPLLPMVDNRYANIIFGKEIFSQLGGCDVDLISDMLYDAIELPEIVSSDLFPQLQTLVLIKIFELLYTACLFLIRGERFTQLPKKLPFGLFVHLDKNDYLLLTTVS